MLCSQATDTNSSNRRKLRRLGSEQLERREVFAISTCAFAPTAIPDGATAQVAESALVGMQRGDFAFDGRVTLNDFAVLKANFAALEKNFGRPSPQSRADLDGNGKVDLDDFGIWKHTMPASPELDHLDSSVGSANATNAAGANLDQDATPNPWTNPGNPYDIDDDGEVLPIDALLLINSLNELGSHPLHPTVPVDAPPPFLDPSGDNELTSLDAQLVIAELNVRSALAQGLAEEVTDDSVGVDYAPPTSDAAWQAACDWYFAELGSDANAMKKNAPGWPAQ